MKRKKLIINLLSIFLATIMVIGQSFIIFDDFSLFTKNIVLTILSLIYYGVVFFISRFYLMYLFNHLDKLENKKSTFKDNWFNSFFDKHPFLCTFITLVIAWLPYFIAFYPIILSPDPSFQIKQFFGISNKYSRYVILIDENVIVTNHHPVIHTMLLGTCLKLGTLINNDNLGLFLYSMIQSTFLISVLSYTIKFLKSLKLSFKYRFLVLLAYAIVPVFPMYAMSGVKDVYFGGLIILYIINLFNLSMKNKITIKDIIISIIIMIFTFLFRNNGIHVMVLSFPLLFLLGKKNIIKYALIFVTIIGLYGMYDKILLPKLHITNTSIRETLSIPFQQTARYVRDDSDKISDKEVNEIDKILKYSTLENRYSSEISDPVKNGFNRESTSTDIRNYFAAWVSGLKKAPLTYIEATVSNTYGYFYPIKTNWYVYYKKDNRINEEGFDYHYNKLNGLRYGLSRYAQGFPYLPIIGLIVNIGINVCSLIIMGAYLLSRKMYRSFIFLMPSYVLILVCIASPVNCYFRYALPFIFAMPLMIGLFIYVVKIKNNCYNQIREK